MTADTGAPAPTALALPSAGFAKELWSGTPSLQAAIADHPFLRGLADGTLPLERYLGYLRQDFVFLLEYARVLALAVAAATDPGEMAALAGLLQATITTELDQHRATCLTHGIASEDLAGSTAAPHTFAYTSHLLAVARAGALAEILAALLPCQWGYADLAAGLAARGGSPVPAYAAWITAYSSAAYRSTADLVWGLVDRHGAAAGPAGRARARRAFVLSLRCEWAFWDGCFRDQTWPGG